MAESLAAKTLLHEDTYYTPTGFGNTDDTQQFTYESFNVRTAISLTLTFVGAFIGWNILGFAVLAFIPALILGLVIGFKRWANPFATLSYSFLQGGVIGGISALMEAQYPGVVVQAVLATFAAAVTVITLTARRVFRTSPRGRKIFMVAGLAYLVFSLLNVGLSAFGVLPGGAWGIYGSLGAFGIVLGALGVLMASYSLIIDVEDIQTAEQQGAPRKREWLAAWSFTATLIWLYTEILRLISLVRN